MRHRATCFNAALRPRRRTAFHLLSVSPHHVNPNPPGKPGYAAKRGAPGAKTSIGTPTKSGAGAAPSPYANFFAHPVGGDDGDGAAGSPGTPGAKPAGAGAKGPLARTLSVRVGGTLSGGGPTLSITPPKAWAPDTPDCEVSAAHDGAGGASASTLCAAS